MSTPRRPRRPRPTAATQQAVAREAKDILLKRLAGGLGGGFPAALGLDLAPIVAALPAELPVLSVRAEQPDNLFRLEDAAIVQFEFQMKRNPDDLERFYRTQFAVAEHYRCPVHTVVLYGPDVLEAPDTLDRGSAVFRVRNVYIGAMDGEAVVAMLRERLAGGQPLSEAEAARIKLLPLMRQRRELGAVLREVALLARGLPRAEREEILGTMVGLAYNYLGPEMSEQLLEVLTMANALENLIADTLVRGRNEGRNEGKAEWRTEGMRDLVRGAIDRRFGQLSAALERQIAAADEPALAGLLDRLPGATSADDLLDD